ncbi:MAG: hypothetical protein GX848_08265 [Clostridiales bacterium]|jgi:hypothetical protein|nr:hypothetical protein [Clostridiales bacterium]
MSSIKKATTNDSKHLNSLLKSAPASSGNLNNSISNPAENVNEDSDNKLKRSNRDTEGRKLSPEQIEFFKGSTDNSLVILTELMTRAEMKLCALFI